MVPKLIHPVPPSTPRTPDSSSGAPLEEDGGAGGGHAALSDTWMTQVGDPGCVGGVLVRVCEETLRECRERALGGGGGGGMR
jgi:hypothetical protein